MELEKDLISFHLLHLYAALPRRALGGKQQHLDIMWCCVIREAGVQIERDLG